MQERNSGFASQSSGDTLAGTTQPNCQVSPKCPLIQQLRHTWNTHLQWHLVTLWVSPKCHTWLFYEKSAFSTLQVSLWGFTKCRLKSKGKNDDLCIYLRCCSSANICEKCGKLLRGLRHTWNTHLKWHLVTLWVSPKCHTWLFYEKLALIDLKCVKK